MGPAAIDDIRTRIPGLAEADGRTRARLMFREGFARIVASAMAEDMGAFVTGWRPDVIVHEDMEMGSWIIAERHGIPHVTIQATAWRPEQRAAVIPTQNELRARHGLAPDPELRGRDGAIFFATRPASIRDPDLPMPSNTRDLRPEPDDRVGGEADELPAWLAAPIGRPRIAVTLGTVNAHRVDLLRPILEGLGTMEVEVAVGLGADPATLGAVPANVRVERYIPMSLVLPGSKAVIHHAGSGTTLAALVAGCPMTVVPIAADQPENADQVARAGVGIVLDPGRLTPDGVREAVSILLRRPGFAKRARAIAREIAAMPDAEDAVSDLEALV